MAERIGTNVGTKVAIDIVDKLMKEAEYLCCYKSYVDNFEEEKGNLSATRSKVLKDIEEAKNKNENQIEADVKLWLNKANGFIQEDIKAKKKWFGLCTNCFWQYQQGKEFEEKTQKIKQLIEKSNFPRIARSTGLPGIKYYSSQNFTHFEDRKLKFEQLKGALKDDKKYMIGLQGMGGTGKTTMATEVGIEAGESKLFDKVIFSVVSKDANVKKIQDNIAKHLGLPKEEGMDKSEQARNLWKRIVEGGEKVLIILDDVWEKLSLRDIGIPLGRYDKGCCSVLLTTRDLKVCREMECQEKIQLEVLSNKDAVDLFLLHAGRSVDGSSSDFKDLALDIVKECGRLPVAVAAVARSINSKPLNDWKEALKRLQTYEPTDDVNEDLTEAYNSLRLSFDNLENEKAKQLFLLCSLFPEDSEIPTEFLSRIAIGLGLCGKADKYYIARSQLLAIKNTLIDSCLLLKAEEECVKMHDLVREVALWTANKEIQAVMDSNTTLMENMRYLSWNINNFPNRFDGSKLEVLLVWINANPFVEVPDAFFEGMICLKVLILYCVDGFSRISAPSLLQPIQSIKNIRTLSMKNWNLKNITILGNLRSLETLELIDCSIIELPNEVGKLEKLKLLGLKSCFIKRNNPLEVIGRCLQLEELYYVLNDDILSGVELPQVTTLPKLQRFHIMGRFGNYYHVDVSTSRYFNPTELKGIFSKEIVKSLAAGAEILELGKDNETGWTNLIPDVVPMEDGGMKT